jgi:hypothetical protein
MTEFFIGLCVGLFGGAIVGFSAAVLVLLNRAIPEPPKPEPDSVLG